MARISYSEYPSVNYFMRNLLYFSISIIALIRRSYYKIEINSSEPR